MALESGRHDFPRFCEVVLGVKTHLGQRQVVEMLSTKSFGVLALPNGWGKTFFLAVFLLWASFYRKWADKDWGQYKVYAIGPEMKHALLIHNEIEALRNNRHKAQVWDGTRHRFLLASKLTPYKTKDKHEAYMWAHNRSRLHFESSEEKLKALEGVDPNVVVYDEARRELYLDFIVNEVILPRGLRVPGFRVLLSSTPLADSFDFLEFFQYASRETTKADWFSRRGTIWENTFLDPKAIEKVSNSLDPRVRDQVLRGEFIAPPDSYFIRDRVLTAFSEEAMPTDLAELDNKYEAGHTYVAGADAAVSEGGDEAVVTAWDCTSTPFRLVFHRALPKGSSASQLLDVCAGVADAFGCQVAYDCTGPLGVELEHQAGERGASFVPIRIGGIGNRGMVDASRIRTTVGKTEALATFRHMVNESLWASPNIPVLRAQMLGYKIKDEHIKTDHLMAQVVAAQLAKEYLPAQTRDGLAFNDMLGIYQGEDSLFVGGEDEKLSPLQRRWREMVRSSE